MNRKIATTLFALVAIAADSQAGFQITFTAGDATRVIGDNDGVYDTDARVGFIAGNEFTLTDSTQATFSYTFSSYSANLFVSSTEGADGYLYAINAAVNNVVGASTAATGKTVSMFTTANNLTSLIGEPAAAASNVTFSLQQPFPTTNNVASVTYGAYYDTTNALGGTPIGDQILAGTDTLRGRSTLAEPNANAAFISYLDAPSFETSSFSMGVYYAANVNGSGFTQIPRFTFTGTSQLEQVPEPSHTALPVGIAVGIIATRRRRVTR